jgi:LacI family transcriptional regulator
MPLTLEDIARESGTSRSTVSRVINGDPRVNEETRQRVMEVVQKHNFQPNLAARGLAAGHARVLGLVIPRGVSTIFADPYFPQLIQGVTTTCNQNEYSTMLWLADAEYERRMARQILYSGLVDGVIIASMLTDDALINMMQERTLPFVLVGRHPSIDHVNYVDVDNRAAARDAVLHLLRLGYQRIATITGPLDLVSSSDRYQGYLEALREKDIPIQPALMVESDYSDDGGYFAMQRLLELKPQAVFAQSDAMAVGALRAISEAGLRVPQDIAVVGFDDMPFAAHATPPLTTVRQPIQRAGMAAAEMLIGLIQNPVDQPQQLILPTELIIRSSCGALQAHLNNGRK